MEKRLIDTYMGFDNYGIPKERTDQINGLLVSKIDSSYSFTPNLHRHQFYEIFVVQEGIGQHHLDFNTFDIETNRIFCIRPGQLHSIEMNPPYSGYFIMFEESFLASFSTSCRPGLFNCFLSSVEYQSQLLTPAIEETCEHLYQAQNKGELRDLYCASLLVTCLIQLQRESTKKIPSTYSTLSKSFLNILESSFPPLASISDYSKQLNVSSNYLNNVIRKETGQTAGHWIRKARLLESKRLLKHSDLSISQLSEALNFTDSAYFCRFFKRLTGCSPTEWRLES
ncbi:AraC family transcriptional regulator [bacterium]|jgi:AraC family transcriptional regulator, transcriptional activator of pobA|nr:AraC family transcriptional regulator [bacterium]